MFFLFTDFDSFAAGYKRTPWGSKSWSGSGAPPHWSGPPVTEPPRPELPIEPPIGPPVDPDWGQRPPHYGSGRWGRTYYYQKPSTETIVIERKKEVPVYVPVQRSYAPLRCGGRTVTRTDPQTGELIIEYVTGSVECNR